MDPTTIISFHDHSPTSSSTTSSVALIALGAPRILFATQKPRSASCLHCVPLLLRGRGFYHVSWLVRPVILLRKITREYMKLFLCAVFFIGLQSIAVYISIFTYIERNGPPLTDLIEYVGALIRAPGALDSPPSG